MSDFIKPYLWEMSETPDIVEDIAVDANNSITYVGFCDTGTKLLTDAKFKIKRVTVSTAANKTTTVTEWAQSNVQYDKVWNDRALYNYSFKK
jgi:hypothetical protein